MQREAKDYFSPVTDSINKFRKYLSDHTLITDLVCKLVITFGVVLIVGGLYLMVNASSQIPQTSSAINSVVSVADWIPGIPFYIGALANTSATTIGLVSWFVGLDLLLVGLGLWVRHKLARFTALTIFALAACFQFIEFLNLGIMGSPASVIGVCVDAILIYFLFSKFDSQTNLKKPLVNEIL
jgi:lysylphosphatidylglycerol synthetase-like protein (DUF2156 family)